MTDVPPPNVPPPRGVPPRTDPRPGPETARRSNASMWLVFLVLAAVILAAIAFSVDRSTSVVDTASDPATTETPDATEVVPAEPAPATTGGDNAEGADGTGGLTTEGTTGDATGGTTGDTTGTAGGTTEGTTGGTTGTGGTTTSP